MNNVNTSLEDLFNTLFPMDSIDPEGFVINSRDLHKAMNVGRDYSNWIKGRISKYSLKEGFDYTTIENLSSPKRATAKFRSQTMIDYYVTVDAAKNLCMVENNPAGQALRTYFIQAEKALRTLEPELTEEIQQKVLGYNQFLESSSTYSMAEAAQLLGTGRTRLMKDLRSKSYLKANNTPYQKTIETGYMIAKLVPTRVGVITVARITAKGLAEPLARLQPTQWR